MKNNLKNDLMFNARKILTVFIGRKLGVILVVSAAGATAHADPIEIYCEHRSGAANLECQIVGKDRKAMSPDDVTAFIDSIPTGAYVSVKSQKGVERTFLVDPNAPELKKLSETKKSNVVSVIARAKADLYDQIEKLVIKHSDDLDARMAQTDLVLIDPSIGYSKFKRESKQMVADLDGYRKNRDKVCTSTPAYEQLSKGKASLQQTLSNILYAFQTPGTCMADFKVFKDKDGAVDIRQLSEIGNSYRSRCKKN